MNQIDDDDDDDDNLFALKRDRSEIGGSEIPYLESNPF